MDENGWPEFKRLVLYRLKELEDDSKIIIDKIDGLKTKVTRMETKLQINSGMYGAIGGALLGIISSIIIQSLQD